MNIVFAKVDVDFNEITVDFVTVAADFKEITLDFAKAVTDFNEITIDFTKIVVDFAKPFKVPEMFIFYMLLLKFNGDKYIVIKIKIYHGLP